MNQRSIVIRCIACGGMFIDDDQCYPDEGGGFIHAKCCGPEPESYVDKDGNPLGPNDPIPAPSIWESDR